MSERLTQFELDQLSAWCDGELDAAATADIEAKVASSAAWAAAYREIVDLSRTMDAWAVRPAAGDLAQRIIARVHEEPAAPRHVVLRLVGVLSGMAAAAAIVLAIIFAGHQGPQPAGTDATVAAKKADEAVKADLAGVAKNDQMVVENLDFFQNYSVATNYDTLEAIDRVENTGGGM
ncbi:MAG: hypothetical protein LLG01_19055 [Planctomycetaceae bacterium]|nr:hypothetical protein [Planctomycetaceae bacterium]